MPTVGRALRPLTPARTVKSGFVILRVVPVSGQGAIQLHVKSLITPKGM